MFIVKLRKLGFNAPLRLVFIFIIQVKVKERSVNEKDGGHKNISQRHVSTSNRYGNRVKQASATRQVYSCSVLSLIISKT